MQNMHLNASLTNTVFMGFIIIGTMVILQKKVLWMTCAKPNKPYPSVAMAPIIKMASWSN